VKKRSGPYPALAVDGQGSSVVPNAGAVLLLRTAQTVGLPGALSEALGPWRRPTARHDPGKVLLDLAVSLAVGGDCLARRPPVDVPEQQVQRDSDEQEGHGHRHVGVAGDSWQRRAGAGVLSAGVRSSGDVDAGVHAHLDDGGHDHDEQVDGTSGSGEALAPRDQRSSSNHHDLTMTGPCDGRIRPWACVALAAGRPRPRSFG
jgi:hypothetical protein